MRDEFNRGDVEQVLQGLGYGTTAEEHGFVMYEHPEFPMSPLKFDFSMNTISSADFLFQLEHEGHNMEVVHAQIESMGY